MPLRRLALVLVPAMVVLVWGGCSLVVDTTGLSSGARDGGEAPRADGDVQTPNDAASFEGSNSLDAGGTDALPDAGDGSTIAIGPNLLPEGTFEVAGGAGCGPRFMATNGTLTLVANPHSGATACQVCSTGPTLFTIDLFGAFVEATQGQTYRAKVWVKGGATPPAKGVLVRVRLYPVEGGPLQPTPFPSPTVVDSTTWKQLTNEATATGDRRVNIYIAVDEPPPGADTCFLVDDLEVRRVE